MIPAPERYAGTLTFADPVPGRIHALLDLLRRYSAADPASWETVPVDAFDSPLHHLRLTIEPATDDQSIRQTLELMGQHAREAARIDVRGGGEALGRFFVGPTREAIIEAIEGDHARARDEELARHGLLDHRGEPDPRGQAVEADDMPRTIGVAINGMGKPGGAIVEAVYPDRVPEIPGHPDGAEVAHTVVIYHGGGTSPEWDVFSGSGEAPLGADELDDRAVVLPDGTALTVEIMNRAAGQWAYATGVFPDSDAMVAPALRQVALIEANRRVEGFTLTRKPDGVEDFAAIAGCPDESAESANAWGVGQLDTLSRIPELNLRNIDRSTMTDEFSRLLPNPMQPMVDRLTDMPVRAFTAAEQLQVRSWLADEDNPAPR